MIWRHFKIKFVLVPSCIGLAVAKYYPLPCRKSQNIFSCKKMAKQCKIIPNYSMLTFFSSGRYIGGLKQYVNMEGVGERYAISVHGLILYNLISIKHLIHKYFQILLIQ